MARRSIPPSRRSPTLRVDSKAALTAGTAEPSAERIQASTEALELLLQFRQPADGVLRAFFRARPELGQRDRAFIAETTFACLRHLRLLRELAPERGARGLVLAALVLVGGRSIRQLEPLLDAGDAAWLAQVRATDLSALPWPVQVSMPDWIWERLRATRSEAETVALTRGLLAPAPLDLRVNTLRGSRNSVLERLALDTLPASPTPYSPLGVRLTSKPALQRHPLFVEGVVEVQDEASQIVACLVAPRRREMVVDFCAGAGGKTLAMGAMMHSEGRLYAFDVSAPRLTNLKERLKRSGLSNVHPQQIDRPDEPRVQRLEGKIDRVLVDAPCSGLGTLRRNPDLKWRQSPQSVTEMRAKQLALLRAAARLVKPGGRLVYATCSVLPEENDEIVTSFLADGMPFRLLDCSEILAEQRIPLATGRFLVTTPDSHGMDGFFAAALERLA